MVELVRFLFYSSPFYISTAAAKIRWNQHRGVKAGRYRGQSLDRKRQSLYKCSTSRSLLSLKSYWRPLNSFYNWIGSRKQSRYSSWIRRFRRWTYCSRDNNSLKRYDHEELSFNLNFTIKLKPRQKKLRKLSISEWIARTRPSACQKKLARRI